MAVAIGLNGEKRKNQKVKSQRQQRRAATKGHAAGLGKNAGELTLSNAGSPDALGDTEVVVGDSRPAGQRAASNDNVEKGPDG